MKVLVIDDTQKHLDSAVKTLEGHDVTLCSSYDEALELLNPRCWDEKLKTYKTRDYWDAVLCDLLMPVGEHTHGQSVHKCVGQEMPFGLTLALTAARCGAKYVLMLTDASHHHNPASAMLDSLGNSHGEPHIFNIDGAKVAMTNFIEYFEFEGEEEEAECYNCQGTKLSYKARSCKMCGGTRIRRDRECSCVKDVCDTCNGTGRLVVQKEGKHWGKFLDQIMK